MHFAKRLGGALAAGLLVSLSVGAIDAMAQAPSPTPPVKTAKPVLKTAVKRGIKKASPKPTPLSTVSPTHRAAVTAPKSLTQEKTHKMRGVGEKAPSGIFQPPNNESNASNPSQPRIPGVN